MDFTLNEQQELLKAYARDFLEREHPESLIRALEDTERGYSLELWKKMAALGWMGLTIPQEYGGAGLGLCELAVLLEEFGRALIAGPFTSTVAMGATALLEAGSRIQKQELLPQVAAGDLILTLALLEDPISWEAAGVRLVAAQDGRSYTLSGIKRFVPDADAAQKIIVAARSSRHGAPEDGVTLFLVDVGSPGVSLNPLQVMGGYRMYDVSFRDVRIQGDAILGQLHEGWPVVEKTKLWAEVAACAYLTGLCQMDLDITLRYVKERVQFGRRIGSFQALQHRLADALLDIDSMRLMTHKAAWSIQTSVPGAVAMVSMAKAWVSEASGRIVAAGQQLHGGIGFTKEYRVQMYFQRQTLLGLMWGDADYHREMVARSLGM